MIGLAPMGFEPDQPPGQLPRPSAIETCMAKLFVAETAKHTVLDCQQVMGAVGIAKGLGYDMERYVRDVIGLLIVGGSSAIQRNNITSLMGLPRES